MMRLQFLVVVALVTMCASCTEKFVCYSVCLSAAVSGADAAPGGSSSVLSSGQTSTVSILGLVCYHVSVVFGMAGVPPPTPAFYAAVVAACKKICFFPGL
eukprot:TRINITY_DN9024_c0_g1_i2.p1 TRINITY_DN9024_c0_g1~~TRINITY_DN9024_c0_g1_i2.p1  ORF type:complete len:100 (+),score=6.66 TRINITY_DN9024_c0_g1_i2:51-350(+)